MIEENVTKMALPCLCPHCGAEIVFEINQPYPTVDVLAADEVPDDIKNAIIQNKDDNSKEPEAA